MAAPVRANAVQPSVSTAVTGHPIFSNACNTSTCLESGRRTPPIAQVIGLGASIDFINSLDLDKVSKYENELHNYAIEELKFFRPLIFE